MLSNYAAGKDWYFTGLKASIVLVFDPRRTLIDTPLQLAFTDPTLIHQEGWSRNSAAGEMAPDVNSSLFHTSFRCKRS
ncbi:hypothetical protein MFIFM68171_08467 [Madurella fahalii]|uniref:Uncharacterized protein n=1 Tax=Madurella fahalii TaxID=1157608 RepID=A0ABQ0GKG2_9PEZI